MKKIVVGLAVMLGFCTCAHQPSGTLDVNKALDYCAEQTQRTLAELKTDSGIDYTMMPRNIMTDEHHWNCRKATKEEWCRCEYAYLPEPEFRQLRIQTIAVDGYGLRTHRPDTDGTEQAYPLYRF